jgi:hypothetical protein
MSKIEVDAIEPQSGTTLTVGASGDTVTVPSGVTLDTSNSTLTLPDNSVTTNKIADSNITLAKLSATGTKDATTFLRGDNSFATIAGGLSEADQWRLTTSFNTINGRTDIASNLERIDTNGQGYLGTGMTQSSGIFTFPSTGIYYITFGMAYQGSTQAYTGSHIRGTIDNSTYNDLATGFDYIQSGSVTLGGVIYLSTLFDCTNTSTHKVRFQVESNGTSPSIEASTSKNATYMTFIKLGDT